MGDDRTTSSNRWERLIEAMDKPLLGLAIITMGLYLLDLHRLIDRYQAAYTLMTLLIDLVFVFDLALKLWVFGAAYIQTPWFLIDLISCLPILDVLANGVLSFRAVRFIRGFRILRILRGLRILRALRTIPAFERFVAENPATEGGRKFHRAMNIGMVALTLVMLLVIVVVRKTVERDYLERIDKSIKNGNMTINHLDALGGGLTPPDDSDYWRRQAVVNDRAVEVYFGKRAVEDQANRAEFLLIVGMMFAMLLFMYIMAYHQLDVSQTQLKALLNLALPRQVAERFLVDPAAYDEKSRMPAAVVFMDFVGFTRTCEQLAHCPDRLSAHLEAAMDRLVGELIKHDLIIDKFIGDAVMSFRGGPLVAGDLAEHAYRVVRAALDSIAALRALNDPYFHRVKIGGAAASDCLIGAFGTSARLSYTILGDGVNLAARLEPASAQCATQNLFCATTYQLCAERPDLVWRRWGRIRVAGKSEPVTVFEAFDAAELGDPAFLATFHRGLAAFERNNFDQALSLFRFANAQRAGGDGPSRGYAQWCEELLPDGPPVGWEPVFETHK
jgi:class 3 adenylate cyclase